MGWVGGDGWVGGRCLEQGHRWLKIHDVLVSVFRGKREPFLTPEPVSTVSGKNSCSLTWLHKNMKIGKE